MTHPDPLFARAAEFYTQRPEFCAYWLHAYQQREGLDDAALAAYLGCSVEQLHAIMLCYAPRGGQWHADIAHIAERFGADSACLSRALAVEDSDGDERVLAVGEVADQLGLSPSRVAGLARTGKLPGAARLGGHGQWIIPQAAVDAYRRRVETRPPTRGARPKVLRES